MADDRKAALEALDEIEYQAGGNKYILEPLATIRAYIDRPSAKGAPGEVPQAFVDYVVTNMPPNTIIADPLWWAPRLWHAAMRAAPPAAAPQWLNNLIRAGNNLSLAAQTSGGVAGRDEGLMAAINDWTQALLAAAPSPTGGEENEP